MKEVREIIRFWEARRRQPLALATLVAARGSSYRRPGARMLISAGGESAGGISAGCIEDDVIVCAREVLRSGAPRLMTFDTRLRFGCAGTIDIFVERVRDELMAELRNSLCQRQGCRLETVLHGTARGTCITTGIEAGSDTFLQTIEPALQLILIGDSSDTDALRAHAELLGWDVVQMNAAPVPPEMLDHRTAVVLATHNFGRDCAALRELLPAGLKYLGLIGSRRRRDDLLFDVMHHRVNCHSRLFAPAGLHLGAESPEEIALSIAAEIQSVFAHGTGEQLRNRRAPIHQPAVQTFACAKSPA
ncbi:MAG: alanine dehydrogenase [Chthoniobacteraceae bacterium]|nr:alanine dehydrogenase [Chthoniobacteraceae bacterium]